MLAKNNFRPTEALALEHVRGYFKCQDGDKLRALKEPLQFEEGPATAVIVDNRGRAYFVEDEYLVFTERKPSKQFLDELT